MNNYMDRIGDAYVRYSINPNNENFTVLKELTGKTELSDVLEATEAAVNEATSIEPLQELERALTRLHQERKILLDQRIQSTANRHLNGRTVCTHLTTLRESIKQRIHYLTRDEATQKHVQQQIFGMCCRLYQEKIEAEEAEVLGPLSYEIARDPEFKKDAKNFNQISRLINPEEKLAFFQDHLNHLQDKYLPGKVIPAQLCQLLIITITHADNPQLIHDIEVMGRCHTQQTRSEVGTLLQAASLAVYKIHQEALPDINRKGTKAKIHG